MILELAVILEVLSTDITDESVYWIDRMHVLHVLLDGVLRDVALPALWTQVPAVLGVFLLVTVLRTSFDLCVAFSSLDHLSVFYQHVVTVLHIAQKYFVTIFKVTGHLVLVFVFVILHGRLGRRICKSI